MLAAAREALVQYGLLAQADKLPPCYAKFGGNLVLGMQVYLNDGTFYIVKVAMQSALDREYRGLSMAHAAMPDNVPRPIGLTSHRSLPVFVSCGVRHKALASIRGSMEVFEVGINKFFATAARAFVAQQGEASIALQEAIEIASTLTPWPDWQGYWGHISADVAALPCICQHGDFAVNNIGVADGELVFFDWEDFGYVDLPGFDLAVLLLSLNDFDMHRLIDRLQASSMEHRLMQNGCACLGMTTKLFLTLFPAYLSLFARMKGKLGYAPEVAGRAISALAQWLVCERSSKGLTHCYNDTVSSTRL